MSFLDRDDERSGNYVLDHWRGALSLPVSYWINGSLIYGLGGTLLFIWFAGFSNEFQSIQIKAALAVLAALGVIMLWLWSAVGIWRSADNHSKRGGSVGWAGVAKAMVIVGAFGSFNRIIESFPTWNETVHLATGHDSIGQNAVSTAQDDIIAIDGYLALGSASDFQKILEATPKVRSVNITSNGGRVGEAKQIADMIRSHHLDTIAGGNCFSACTVILLAGERRSAMPGARLGFHQGSYPGLNASEFPALNDGMREALQARSVDPRFVDRAFQATSTEIWIPTEDQLFDAGVLNFTSALSISQDIKHIVDETNATLPKKIDSVTKLVKLLPTQNSIEYVYYISATANRVDFSKVKNTLQPKMREGVCSGPAVRRYFKSGFSFKYHYFDISKKDIGQFIVDSCPEIPKPPI